MSLELKRSVVTCRLLWVPHTQLPATMITPGEPIQWSLNDHNRSLGEGWKFQNGYVHRAFNSRGETPFKNNHEVVAHIINQALAGSEWHKNLYMRLPWTSADSWYAASNLGWSLALGKYQPTYSGYDLAVQQATEGNFVAEKAISHTTKMRFLELANQNKGPFHGTRETY